jgi:ferredoxin
LATTHRKVRLVYANRDADSVIFGGAIDALAVSHHDRLEVVHHLDVERGFVDADLVTGLVDPGAAGAGYYLCGPGPFMDVVEAALLAAGVDPAQIHVERFVPAEVTATATVAGTDTTSAATSVTIDLDGRCETADHRPGTTILQMARQLGMAPPFSCESGSCATCMARVLEGSAVMRVNNALTDDEVAEGWVLTCQAVPSPPGVKVVYGFEGA